VTDRKSPIFAEGKGAMGTALIYMKVASQNVKIRRQLMVYVEGLKYGLEWVVMAYDTMAHMSSKMQKL
jgi:hypothetical protein